MKKISCVILGYGHRGSCYAEYALKHPNELEVIAVIDPDKLKQAKAKKVFGLKEESLFDNLNDFLICKIPLQQKKISVYLTSNLFNF